MLETPAGINSVFSIVRYKDKCKWVRDYEKTAMDEGWEESVETHAQYLKSVAYEVFALYELYEQRPVHPDHWRFYLN